MGTKAATGGDGLMGSRAVWRSLRAFVMIWEKVVFPGERVYDMFE